MKPISPRPSREAEHARGRVRLARQLLERVDAVDDRADLVARQHLVARPRVVAVERHELDEAHLVARRARELGERQRLLLGEAAQRHGVHLDRPHLGMRADRLEAAQHLRQRVAPGELEEAVALERVDRHVHARDARRPRARPRRARAGSRWWSARGPRCPRTRASIETSRGNSRRTSGSPPVRRRSVTPIRASTRTTRSISSKRRISSRSSQGSPSAGMQYWQRKLQRSVTETRRSEISRPWPSTRGSTRHLVEGYPRWTFR